MKSSTKKTLACIGVGPRATSIAALAAALQKSDIAGIDVLMIEKNKVGANWSGAGGFTDGTYPLDTCPHKDVTFPGAKQFGPVADSFLQSYSFQQFARNRDIYDEWVSAGTPKISHATFANYQEWCLEQLNIKPFYGEVKKLSFSGSKSVLHVERANGLGSFELIADGVLLSGPGEPISVPGQDDDDLRIFNGQTFWQKRHHIWDCPNPKVAIVGTGQSAGTIACSLLKENAFAQIDMVTPLGFLPVQSSGKHENAMCSSACDDWTDIDIQVRREICGRINSGVMESYIKDELDGNDRINVVRGRVDHINAQPNTVELHAKGHMIGEYDFVIMAIGFDPMASVEKLIGQSLRANAQSKEAQYTELDYYLRVPNLQGSLHVPSLASLSQGPGLALLSCLSTMASRVLTPYMPENRLPTELIVGNKETVNA